MLTLARKQNIEQLGFLFHQIINRSERKREKKLRLNRFFQDT